MIAKEMEPGRGDQKGMDEAFEISCPWRQIGRNCPDIEKETMLLFTLVFCLTAFALASQVCAQPMEDVVHLKNGGIIRGMIIEQIAGEALKIQTRDGNVFVYTMDEIAQIDQEPAMGMGASGPKKPAPATGVEVGTLFGISDISGPYDNWTSIYVPGGVFPAFGTAALYISQFPSARMAIGQEIAFARTSSGGSLTTLLLGVRVAFFPKGNSRSGIYALGQGFLFSTSFATDSDDDSDYSDNSEAELFAGGGVGYQWRIRPALVLRMEGQYRRWLDAKINNVLLVLGLGTRLGGGAMAKESAMGMGASVPKKAAPATGVEVGTMFGITHNITRKRTSIEVPDGGIGGISLPALYVLHFPSEHVGVGPEIAFARISYFGSATTLLLGARAEFLPRGSLRSGSYALGQGSLFSVFEDNDSEAYFSAGVGMGYQWRIGPALVLRMEGQYQRWFDAKSNSVLLVLGLGTRLGGAGN